MVKSKLGSFGLIAILILALSFFGCGGGGGSGDTGGNNPPTPTPTPTIQVVPTDYDFGTVTTGNTPAPLEVKVTNNGSVPLNVSRITLRDSFGFFNLDATSGANACGTSATLDSSNPTCTFNVSFQPATAGGPFPATVEIGSNASSIPVVVNLRGTAEAVNTINVRINQIQATCPVVSAYVSVTDQGGFPLTSLGPQNFTVDEGNVGIPNFNVAFVSQVTSPISIAVVMDYSGSLQDTPDAINDMQNGLVSFVQNLGANDRVEIIKFGTTFSVVQAFTSDKTALEAAILSQVNVGPDTLLFDSVNQAVTNTGQEMNIRKAVIVITDGNDEGGNPPTSPFSAATLQNVIDNANSQGVPIFTIGIGANVNAINLTDMADQTGGQFFEAQISDNLNTIYQQISSILFEDQYVIDYNGNLATPNSALLTITVNTTITGSDTKLITCP